MSRHHEQAGLISRQTLSRWFGLALALASIGSMTQCRATVSPPPPSEQFVLAYTRVDTGRTARLETRVTLDGTAWSLPTIVPVSVSAGAGGSSIPGPGLATDGRVYQVAWFDPASVLNTRLSSDGSTWTGGATHGSALPIDTQSRPSLAVGNGRWIAAVRLRNGRLVIQPLGGTALSLSTLVDATTTPPTPLTSTWAPALAFGNGRFVLAYLDGSSSVVRVLSSLDGGSWSPGGGVTIPFPSGVTPPPPRPVGSPPSLQGEGAPSLSFATDSMFHLAVTRAIQRSPSLTRGQIITHRSRDGASWTFAAALEPSTAPPIGLALAGPTAGQVVVDPSGSTSPDVWVAGVLRRPPVTPAPPLAPASYSAAPISLAHGPRRIDIRNATLRFNRFKRIPDPGLSARNQTEDVTLNVTHLDGFGATVSSLGPWTVQNATLRQSHFWSEGRGSSDLPELLTLIQPGDTVRVAITGRDGTARRDLTFAEFIAGRPYSRNESLVEIGDTTQPFFYQLFVSCDLMPR